MTAEGFWWDCGLIFDEVSAGVFGGGAQPLLAGLRMPEVRWLNLLLIGCVDFLAFLRKMVLLCGEYIYIWVLR